MENKRNANFAEHAEHESMTFVASHPELETRAYESQALSEHGTFSSEADALRHVGHDQRVTKLRGVGRRSGRNFSCDNLVAFMSEPRCRRWRW